MKAISNEYREMAVEHMSLNITDDEMFIILPSERNNKSFYRVDVDEATMQPKSCNCPGHLRWHTACKHMALISECFADYAAPVVESAPQQEEPKITEIETGNWYIINSNTGIWRREDDGEWIAVGEMPLSDAIAIVEGYLEKQQAVAEAEHIVAQVVTQPEPDKEDQKPIPLKLDVLDAPLTSNRGFSLLKVS